MSSDLIEARDCGCPYELVEDGAVQRKRVFHEPGCTGEPVRYRDIARAALGQA